ncbi:hypothetical protein [Rhizobium sp. BG4]|uniref:hypothetical protein n=1 Tax=Rhizobium sp. BG4 TaxID=2613770 RepID=UPI001FF01FC9|nr:hypothetical protein [Rhizobium sp. BG4]
MDHSGDGRPLLWIALIFLSSFSGWSWYWFIRSIIFYMRNDFDFSIDFGPKIYMSEIDDERYVVTPRQKLVIAWPMIVIISLGMVAGVVLALTGVLNVCRDCVSL